MGRLDRDEGLLESAIASPRPHFHYGDPSLFDLAAAYAEAIIQNHPFVDGNKRTAYLAAEGFLTINGCYLHPPKGEVETMMKGAASGEVTRDELAAWIAEHTACIEE